MFEALDLYSSQVPTSLAKFGLYGDYDTVEELFFRTCAEINRIRISLAEKISWSEPIPAKTPPVPTKKTLNGELWRGMGLDKPPVTPLKLELD